MFVYAVKFTPDEAGYLVSVPDLPHLVVRSESVHQGVELIKQVLRCTLQEHKKIGEPLPRPTDVRDEDVIWVRLQSDDSRPAKPQRLQEVCR